MNKKKVKELKQGFPNEEYLGREQFEYLIDQAFGLKEGKK